jgi:hypothetical protein
MKKWKESIKGLGINSLLMMGRLAVILFGVGAALTFSWAEQPLSPAAQVMEHLTRMKQSEATRDTQQKRTQNLIDRYKSLKRDIGNAENEVERGRLEESLKRVIGDIVKIYPEATSERDGFGLPTDVDIEYVERAFKVQGELFKIQLEQEIAKLAELGGEMGKKHEENLKEQEIIQQKAREETERLYRLIELRKQLQSTKSPE